MGNMDNELILKFGKAIAEEMGEDDWELKNGKVVMTSLEGEPEVDEYYLKMQAFEYIENHNVSIQSRHAFKLDQPILVTEDDSQNSVASASVLEGIMKIAIQTWERNNDISG